MRAGLRRRLVASVLTALLLGVAAAMLGACGSSGGGLIPSAVGGPLQSDVEAVERAAESGNGNCAKTEAALLKTDQDYAALPSSIDSGLRDKVRLGIENLHKVAKEACELSQAQTNTTTTPKTTSTQSTPTQSTPTQTTTSTTTPTTPATPEPEAESPGAGGGTPAPGEGNGKPPGEGAGGAAPEEGNGAGNPAGGAEGGK